MFCTFESFYGIGSIWTMKMIESHFLRTFSIICYDMNQNCLNLLIKMGVITHDFEVLLFSVFTSHVIKIKIVTIRWKRSRVWDTIDDWYINNLAKNQVSAVFHSRVICRYVSPKFIELRTETPCLCPSEGHKHGSLKVTETSVTEFCYWNENYRSRAPTHWEKCFFYCKHCSVSKK